MAQREEIVFMAKVYSETERYEEMRDCLKQLALLGEPFSHEERHLLSIAYSNLVGSKRNSLRLVQSIQNHTFGNQVAMKHLEIMRQRISKELQEICEDLLNLIQKKLMFTVKDMSQEIYYTKIQGDYYRYMAEYDLISVAKEQATLCYNRAQELGATYMPLTAINLGIILSYSVFMYEISNDTLNAIMTAKNAYEKAVSKLEEIPEEEYKDVTLILQLLKDNLTLWTSELEDDLKETE